jgi:hypothetical protein
LSSSPPLPQPIPFRFLLDEAVRHARRHFKSIYPAVGFPVALLGGAIPLAQAFMFRRMGQADPASDGALSPFMYVAAFSVVMLVWLAVYYFGYAALFVAAMDALAGRPVSMRRAWGFALRPRVIGTLVLATLAMALGTMLCFVPGIYLGLLYSLIVPVMAEEGIFGTAALGRSAQLTRYNPQRDLDADPRFKVFVVVFVGTLLGWVVGMLVELPMMAIQQVLMLREVAAGRQPDPQRLMATLAWVQVPSQILSMLVQTAFHLYVCFGLSLLFFDVKGRKEGLDLETAIARLYESRFGAPPEGEAALAPAPV